MSSIGRLQQILGSSSRRQLLVADEPRELRQIVRGLSAELDHFDASPSSDRRLAAIGAYMRNGVINDPKQLRILCFSIMDVVPSIGKRLLSFPEPFRKLLEAAAALPPLWFRKCYQGLLTSYFGEQNAIESADPAERESWLWLRQFLAAGIARLRSLRRVPAWVVTLESRNDLLDDEPCATFGSEIADGNMERFDQLRADLEIPSTSWLIREAALAGVKAGCARGDQAFRACVPNLLELIESYPLIADIGTASLLRRYAAIEAAPESSALLQKAIALWGNPLRRANLAKWDQAGDAAIQMCSTWLKTSLIEDFFEHLSADGSADLRRVTFWKRYVPYIDDMYFALGRNARNDQSHDTKRLRETMGDRLLRLEGPASKNNAFLMQMGGFIVVEFGLLGNAAFIFKRDNLPFELESEIRDEGKTRWQAYARDRLLHVDGNDLWENAFAASITKNIGIPDPRRTNAKSNRVSALNTASAANAGASKSDSSDAGPPFSEQSLADCCLLYGVKFRHRSQNVFDVSASDQNPGLKASLERWGFRYNRFTRVWTLKRS